MDLDTCCHSNRGEHGQGHGMCLPELQLRVLRCSGSPTDLNAAGMADHLF